MFSWVASQIEILLAISWQAALSPWEAGHSTCLKKELTVGIPAKHEAPAPAKTTVRIILSAMLATSLPGAIP
jgi:hypothetical protein